MAEPPAARSAGLRVLLVASHLAPRQMALWNAVVQRGVELDVVGTLEGIDTGGRPAETGLGVRWRNHVVRPRRVLRRDQLWWWYPGLSRIEQEVQPDVVHVLSEAWGLLTLQALRLGRPTVVHGCDNMFDHGPRWEAMVRQVVTRHALRRTAAYVSWNQRGAELARAHGLREQASSVVIPQTVPDPGWFVAPKRDRAEIRARFGLPLGEPVVAYVGRLVPEKGVHWLLESVADMATPAQVLIVGDGPERNKLESVARALRLRATFLGALNEQEAIEALTAADVAVIPSLTTKTWMEQFGRVAVEAMLAGPVVIASATGALPEVLGDAAVLVAEGSRQELTAALDRLTADVAMRMELSEAARRRAMKLYDPGVLAAQLVDVWMQAAGGTTT